jgi:hypothetical protein
MKNLQKKITEFLPASSTKKYVQIFFLFYRKNLSVWNFLYKQKTGFFSVLAEGRIKPWGQNYQIQIRNYRFF